MIKRFFILVAVLALLASLVGCRNFLEGEQLDNDPNRATQVPTDNLFVGMQVNMYGVLTGPLSFVPVMFLQQMSGVSQHYSGYELFEMTGDEFADQWFDLYGGGGLVDMKALKTRGVEEEKRTLVGITKLWEALAFSTASDLWGDIPYSEACNPDIAHPKYDKQSFVRDQVLDLIDSAIADLNVGQTKTIDVYDFTYAGDTDKWIAAAHSLKARILLNWAEVNPENYALAMTEAQMGIKSNDDNWQTRHSNTSGEESLWYQFELRRFGYVRCGAFIVDLMENENDPRVPLYFGLDGSGGYSGSKPGENNGDASFLNPETYGAADWDVDLLTWYETQFIIAECQYNTGDEAGALATLNDVIQPGLEAKWGLEANSLPRYTGISGADVLKAIMMEKYKALFLNVQIWSDWKRTNLPVFTETPLGREIPRRMLYSLDELNTNPNVTFLGFYVRTENDPGD
ncbi:MAG: SusD/RagB family nutrient-binding outer membrane lipoprotein [bacterium]